MKKYLLLLLSFVAAMGISAQKVVLDFTDPVGSWKLPLKADAVTAPTQFSNGTYTITLSASYTAYAGGSEKNGFTYLMIGKEGSTLTLPAFDFAVGRIEVVGNNGASTATGMNIFVGEEAVSTATTGSVGTNSYAIAEGKQTAGTVYTLKVTNAHNAQITKINVYEAEGTCGDNLTWSLEDGILVISGTGAMTNYGSESNVPWYSSRSTVSLAFISDGVTSIGDYAFYGCSGLTSITIPNSVTSIGDCAFQGCSGLTSITIPDGVTSIGSSAFRECYGLTSITIPNSVTSIGSSAFHGCSGLTSITIPNSVTSIGHYAFYECSSLTSITIPDGVTSIEVSTFEGCSGLTSITIPNSVTSIEWGAFARCSSLTYIYVSQDHNHYFSVDGILFNKDKSCIICFPGGLSGEYNIPNSVTSIGDTAFAGCENLTSVTIPNSVTCIGRHAFALCRGLSSVTIPNSVTSIEELVFWYCSGLSTVNVLATTPPYPANGFLANAGTSTIHVCEGLADIYKTASGWSEYDIVDDIPAPYGEDYHVNFDKNIQRGDYSTEHPNRWLESFTLNGKTVTMNTNHQPYQDMTSTEIVLWAGQQVSVDCKQWNTATYQYTSPWMHSYIYIDENNDGIFSFQVNNDTHTVNGELVSYSYYSFGGEERIGWNSKGEETNWGSSIVPPSFIAPSTPGTYRLRFKTDWNDLNPAGSLGSENNVLGTNGILRNSGCIVDITIRVVDTQLVDGNIYEMESDLNNISLSYTRTFNNTEWQALYVPFQMSYEDWADEFEVAKINNFHQYDRDDDGVFDELEMEVLKVKSGTLKQNHPYLIKALTTGEKTITVENATLYAAEENGLTCSSVETQYTFTGTYAGMSGADMYANHYYSMGGGSLIYAEDATADLKPYRWYLQLTDREGQVIPAPNQIRVMEWNGQTTSVESLSLDNAPARAISLDGRSVRDTKARGLYIVNGKKVLR